MKPLPVTFFLGAAVVPEVAAAAQFPLAYYIATISILGSILVVLKAWSWVRTEITRDSVTKTEFAVHLTEQKQSNEKLDIILGALQSFPCVRKGECHHQHDQPALTPRFGLPPFRHEESDE
jgi:hypothetical protein